MTIFYKIFSTFLLLGFLQIPEAFLQGQVPINPTPNLIIQSNKPKAHWALYQQDIVIRSGSGSESLFVSPDQDYKLEPQELEGYNLKMVPSGWFNLRQGQIQTINLQYERSFGTIEISALLKEKEWVQVTLQSKQLKKPFQITLKSSGGKIHWNSTPLPKGKYSIEFYSPNYFVASPIEVSVGAEQHILVSPQFKELRTVHVTANIPQATFILKSDDSSATWQGNGVNYTFEGIPEGSYHLSFSNSNPHIYIAPDEIPFILRAQQDKSFKVDYSLGGKIIIHSPQPHARIVISPIEGKRHPFKKELSQGSHSLDLPEGHYRMSSEDRSFSPLIIQVSHLKPVEITLPTEGKKSSQNIKGNLTVSINVSNAAFTLYRENKGQEKTSIGQYKGKYNVIALDEAQTYVIVFEEIPHFETPEPIHFTIVANEPHPLNITYFPKILFLSVPEGDSIIGDPFNEGKEHEKPSQIVFLKAFRIGAFEVTNAEFATWLTQALKEGKIKYESEGKQRGWVKDQENHLLFKTMEADPDSQIAFFHNSEEGVLFRSLPGKDLHPVIFVSWYGANAFCHDHHYRLPTEAEWEKAASIAQDKEHHLKKYRYGFSKDTIDKTWANYKYNDKPILHFKALTSLVGFYNGINYLPLEENDKTQYRTHQAVSPIGAYDMSGNVYEWVADWYQSDYYKNIPTKDPQGPSQGKEKIAKGGCYDSLEESVRVSSRLPLLPDHVDAYTGFRVAQSK